MYCSSRQFACIICTTGFSLTDLVSTDVVGQWADRRFVNTLTIPSGMICQSRTASESQALYICEDEDGAATRMCQSYWIWNGSIPECSPDPGRKDGKCIFACSYIFLRNQVLSMNIVHTALKFLSLAGPEYEEVVKLRKNASYELTKPGIEMKTNEAYHFTQN